MTGRDETTIACVGCGLIGSAWAALFAAKGFPVRAFDPSSAAEAGLDAVVGQAAEALGLSERTIRGRISFTTDIGEALAGADFVQESAPESLALKQALFAEIDRIVPATTIIASSTSDFPMTQIQRDCRHPQRTLVGHPINPPYAVPLVEVVPSLRTSRSVVEKTSALYRAAGKKPLVLTREVTGFVANRLQMAVTREALQLVARGKATVAEIDQALMYGIGPRFVAVGLFGGYILNLPGHDVDAWLRHLAAFDFGQELVHAGPLPEWTPQVQAAVAKEWRDRIAPVGTDALRRDRDTMTLAIGRLQDGI